MVIQRIITSGVLGAESAALDVAIRLKIPYGGFTYETSMLDGSGATRRYRLQEGQFDSFMALAEANLALSDAVLVFSRSHPNPNLQQLVKFALDRDHPCLHIEFDQADSLQAAFIINLWAAKHDYKAIFVTGAEDEPGIYHDVYDCLYSALMLGKEEYPGHEQSVKEKKPIPRTVQEAVSHLIEVLPLKDRVAIANMSASEIIELHFSLGHYIRNSFELWSGNEQLMWSCAQEVEKEGLHADEATAIILARLSLELEKTHKLRAL